ncbi:MAG: hypothetical protein RL292_361 [Candidatus Parcubacteria bacterium]|jgi:geranylgeranyl diphosphate synthase type I
MDIVLFKQVFDPLFARHLASKHDVYLHTTDNPIVIQTLQHIDMVAAGGKRFRPYLIWSMYQNEHPEAQIHEILDLLIAIELFHVFCLVHDDIMDKALLRHGTQTIHSFATDLLQKAGRRGNLIDVGNSQAILAGDILFNWVFAEMQKDSWGTPESRKAVRDIFTTLVDEVCIGQMLDIDLCTETETTYDRIMQKNKLKTARYSFARPLHIGALIGGRDDLIPFVLSFGEHIGNLFQMQDDMLDIIGDSKDTKKGSCSDVIAGQHTVLTQYITEKNNPVHIEKLKNFFGKETSDSLQKEVRVLFEESGALTYGNALISQYFTDIYEMIRTAQLEEKDASLFTYITSLLDHRTS